MRQFDEVIIIYCNSKVSSKEGHMIIFTICFDTEPDQDPKLFSDPALLKQIISDPASQH
jgi:hypothetical protein